MNTWRDWVHYIMRGRDPTTTAVLAEDLGAVAGLGIACTLRGPWVKNPTLHLPPALKPALQPQRSASACV